MRYALTILVCLCVVPAVAQDKKEIEPMQKAINRSTRLRAATTRMNLDMERAKASYDRERAKLLEAYLKVIEQDLNDSLTRKKLDEANDLNLLKKHVEAMQKDPNVTPVAAPAPEPAKVAEQPKTGEPRKLEDLVPKHALPAKKQEALGGSVLHLLQPQHFKIGSWEPRKDGLYNKGLEDDIMFIPVAPPREYDVVAKVTRMDDSLSYICFSVPYGHKGLWLIFDWNRTRSLVDNVGKSTNHENSVLPVGVEKTLTMQIRNTGATCFVDGEELFRWEGEPKEAFNPIPTFQNKAAMEVRTVGKSQWRITSLEVRLPK